MLEISQKRIVRAAVLCPYQAHLRHTESADSRLSEAVALAKAIFVDVCLAEIVSLREIKPATYFNKGFLESLALRLSSQNIELLIVDAPLSPIQQRNLEKELCLKVIDRTALILEIFGERAQTGEGKLQVELAHLTYQRSRLVRSWTHLERQRGGAGFLGGPGEKQIELDRRLIDEKIVKIKKELEKVKNTRALQRGNRRRVPYPVAALVGYTNAGKSTLFNRLSGASVLAKDMLFATLDPTLRKITLPSGREVILSDTVGFISDLPHELIMAFRSTLEEVLEADILIHVRDVSSAETEQQRQNVFDVLKTLGLENLSHNSKYIEVLNKIDLLDEENRNIFNHQVKKAPDKFLMLSALNGEGCAALLSLIDDKLSLDFALCRIYADPADGKLRAWLYQNAEVMQVLPSESEVIYQVKISSVWLERFQHMFPKTHFECL